MNEIDDSPLDIDALEAEWRDAAPPRGFARAVMARLPRATPAVAARPGRSWLVAALACGCVVLMAILASGSRPERASPMATLEPQADLGMHRD